MTTLRPVLAALLLVLPVLVRCGPSDPQARILSQRASWKVDLLSWAMADDGGITISARLSGPVRSELKRLTVRIEMLNAQGEIVDDVWETLDLSAVQRGGPEDIFIRLPARSTIIEGIGINLVSDPDPEEIQHIEELNL